MGAGSHFLTAATKTSCFYRLFLVSWLVDENGDFQTITNASVPITCCKLDKKNTNYPKKVEYKDVTQCLTTADEEYTNHEVLHDCNISLVRAASAIAV